VGQALCPHDLAGLKAATNIVELAPLLHFTPKGLSYVVYHIGDAQKYTTFEIPKRSGGKPIIRAPEARLKLLQQRLQELLQRCLNELEDPANPRKALAHGFVPGKSIITNARQHQRRRYVLNVDIKDFFPSLNFGRVRGFFISDNRFALNPAVATVIAQIACFNNELPQGSPCSPIVSNLIGHVLDVRLARLAREHKVTYSRYADDLTFSTNKQDFPQELARPSTHQPNAWVVGDVLRKELKRAGFEANDAKTRLQFAGSRQAVTGLVVNSKVNVPPEYYRSTRSMCNSLFGTGSFHVDTPAGPVPGTWEQLLGRLSYLWHVKNIADQRRALEKRQEPAGIKTLFDKTLFYWHFVANEFPTIVTEGKTDISYLKLAIGRLVGGYPRLGEMKAGKLLSKVRYLKFSRVVHEVMQVGGGAGDLKFLVANFRKRSTRYKHAPRAHPVIVLVDNDEGGKDIFALAKQLGIPAISMTTVQPFYRIWENLYLVKTPEKGVVGKSMIEDLFDPALLKTKLGSKTFDPGQEQEDGSTYGKQVFVERVVRPNAATVNFDGFKPLLDRIDAVIADYAAVLAAKVHPAQSQQPAA